MPNRNLDALEDEVFARLRDIRNGWDLDANQSFTGRVTFGGTVYKVHAYHSAGDPVLYIRLVPKGTG